MRGRKIVLVLDLPVATSREETERYQAEHVSHIVDGNTNTVFCASMNYPTPWNAIQLHQTDQRTGVFELKCHYCNYAIASVMVPLEDVEELAKAIAFMKGSPAP